MKKILFFIMIVMLGIFQFSMANALEKGFTKVKVEGEFQEQKGAHSYEKKIKLERGVTDRLVIGIEGEFSKEEGDSFEYAQTKIEAAYAVTDDKYLIASEIEAFYDYSHSGDSDEIGLKLTFEKPLGRWEYQLETEFSHEIGEDKESGVAGDAELKALYDMKGWGLGYVYDAGFGRFKERLDYNEQDHSLGPVVTFNLPVIGLEIGTELTYLRGLSDAAQDNTLKYELDIEF